MFIKFLAIFGTIISGSSEYLNNNCREYKIYRDSVLSNHINELCDSNLIISELCYNSNNKYLNNYFLYDKDNETNIEKYDNIENYDYILSINYNFLYNIKNLLYIFMILLASVSISLFIVSYFLYSNMITNKKYLYQENLDDDDKDFFHFKYIEEYDDLSNNKITNEKYEEIKNKYVKETTPVGDIYMSYDITEGAFIYYSKTSTIRYKYLDSVARLFVIKFDCKKLYYHLHDQIVKSFEKLDNIEVEESDNEEKSDNEEESDNEQKYDNKDNNKDQSNEEKRDNNKDQSNEEERDNNKDQSNEEKRDNNEDNKLKLNFNNVRYSNASSDNEDVFANFKSYNTNNNKLIKNKIDKKCNKFIYKGNIDDFRKIYNVTIDEKDIHIYKVECNIINNLKFLKNLSFKEFKEYSENAVKK